MGLRLRLFATTVFLLAAVAARGQTYAIDFLATAATGAAMDPGGRVVAGLVGLPPACEGCPPSFDVPAIWAGGTRHLLELPAAGTYVTFAGISAQGWVAGAVMRADSTGGAGRLWVPRPDGSGYDARPLGVLPGYEDAMPAGIDARNRVFGLARTWFVGEAPFVWSEDAGMQDLRALGYPAEPPVAVSPEGTVATSSLSYRFGEPGSVTAVTPPPPGFHGMPSALTGAVNDAGTRASFLLSTSGTPSGYRYLARHTEGSGWQVLAGPVIAGQPFGIGSVDPAGTVTASLKQVAYRAAGPTGPATPVANLISAAYGAPGTVAASVAGDQADDGSFLASVLIGRSMRLVKLVPVQPCVGSCMRVASLELNGRMIPAPGQPGQCVPGASNQVRVRLVVSTPTGQPVRGATIRGRFLDDEHADVAVTLTTNVLGRASAGYAGPACVGAVAFLVDGVERPGLELDRTVGSLASYVVPRSRP